MCAGGEGILKRFVCAAAAAALLLCMCARAASYSDASSRINFYYQYDGGETDERGTWDMLLESRLYALCGHSTIYPYTSQYLTGRGCCLFAFSNAWQYLLGYCGTQSGKADILYGYLSQKPVWSNKNSSLSPPYAAGYYAAYLGRQSGVTRYTGSLTTFSALQSFFEGGKGVLITSVPGHCQIAVGCTVHGGIQYVQIVDSTVVGTIQSGRCPRGVTFDFSAEITPANALSYRPYVRQYWVRYSDFKDVFTVKYAFRTGSMPANNYLEAEKTELIIRTGESTKIKLIDEDGEILYTVSDPALCGVDETGRVYALAPGHTEVSCVSAAAPGRTLTVDVYCVDLDETAVIVTAPGAELALPYEGTLPRDASVTFGGGGLDTYGVTRVTAAVTDSYGDGVMSCLITAVMPDPDRTLVIPEGVRLIEAGAFEDTGIEYLVLPQSLTSLDPAAFEGCALRAVFVGNPFMSLPQGAFGDAEVIYGLSEYEMWANAQE